MARSDEAAQPFWVGDITNVFDCNGREKYADSDSDGGGAPDATAAAAAAKPAKRPRLGRAAKPTAGQPMRGAVECYSGGEEESDECDSSAEAADAAPDVSAEQRKWRALNEKTFLARLSAVKARLAEYCFLLGIKHKKSDTAEHLKQLLKTWRTAESVSALQPATAAASAAAGAAAAPAARVPKRKRKPSGPQRQLSTASSVVSDSRA